MLCVTLRRNAGPTFPSGKIEWDAKQIEFARKFCSKQIKNEKFCDYQQKNITSQLDQLGVTQQSYVTIVSACESAHEAAYDQILSEEKKQKGIGRGLQANVVETTFNVISFAPQGHDSPNIKPAPQLIHSRRN